MVQPLRLLRIVAISDRPRGDDVPLVGIVQPNVFHVRGIEAHVRVLQRQGHVRVVERIRRVARLEGEPFQHPEYPGGPAADGRGAHLAGADGEHDADAVPEVGGAGDGDELPLRFVPEDVDGVVGDERAVEEFVGDSAV